MKIFKQLTSQVIPLEMDHVDTDMIIPAQYLTKVNREGYGSHLFQHIKEQDEQFVFNNIYYADAKIMLTKTNFGCGSSREHAVWALMQAGIEVIIAESFSDIFYNNAAKNGLLTISLSEEVIAKLLDETRHNKMILTVDLATQIIKAPHRAIYFDFDPFRKQCFLKGQDDLDYLLEATA